MRRFTNAYSVQISLIGALLILVPAIMGIFQVRGDRFAALKFDSHNSVPLAGRYWPFQWIELSVFLALTMLPTGFGFWWIRNRPS